MLTHPLLYTFFVKLLQHCYGNDRAAAIRHGYRTLRREVCMTEQQMKNRKMLQDGAALTALECLDESDGNMDYAWESIQGYCLTYAENTYIIHEAKRAYKQVLRMREEEERLRRDSEISAWGELIGVVIFLGGLFLFFSWVWRACTSF